ncbi:MAG: polyprenol monophosphomannose synthase [candidate division WOR-3 bacterium]|nr:polyprenol monophosphomannose synthase [candidate division WOR-3 bacterium]MCX7836418.1 polyprenol monophosphomannose synthase [candidate division WOR-3 bacterium]MDW8113735.1 polyprenol monophosphomannose synthase [candidate division WOR-3 bacterium]
MPKILIIFPTYNEAENIKDIIDAVLDISPDIDVLVIDDNSPDKTYEIVENMAKENKRINLIKRERKLGLGTAYVLGFKYAIEKNYDYCFEMDADFSHNPKDIPRFLELMNDYDLVIGSRYISGISVVNWPLKRLLLSYFANIYARIFTGCPIKDLTSGFKCYKVSALKKIDLNKLKMDGYAFQIEIHWHFWRNNFKIKEIPIIFIERRLGESKMSKRIIWQAFIFVLKLFFKRLFNL